MKPGGCDVEIRLNTQASQAAIRTIGLTPQPATPADGFVHCPVVNSAMLDVDENPTEAGTNDCTGHDF